MGDNLEAIRSPTPSKLNMDTKNVVVATSLPESLRSETRFLGKQEVVFDIGKSIPK